MPSRPRRLTISLLATLLALGVVQLGSTAAVAVDGTALVGLANQDRALEGRAPVAYDALLERISDDRARQMAATDVLAHDMTYVANQLVAAGVCFSGYGEIIASERGYPTYDPARTMAQWWASPGHHAIIVGDYNAAGGSHARSASGSAYSAMVFVKLCALPAHTTAVSRIAGTDRYGTAAAISRSSFAPGVAVAYVATGESFPDALAGAAAAAHDGGPVLLTARDVIPPATLDELTRLRPARIVVLGGPGVISDWCRGHAGRHGPGGSHRGCRPLRDRGRHQRGDQRPRRGGGLCRHGGGLPRRPRRRGGRGARRGAGAAGDPQRDPGRDCHRAGAPRAGADRRPRWIQRAGRCRPAPPCGPSPRPATCSASPARIGTPPRWRSAASPTEPAPRPRS